jgi:hypothetical protein
MNIVALPSSDKQEVKNMPSDSSLAFPEMRYISIRMT